MALLCMFMTIPLHQNNLFLWIVKLLILSLRSITISTVIYGVIMKQLRRLFLFAGFDKDNIVDDTVVYYEITIEKQDSEGTSCAGDPSA